MQAVIIILTVLIAILLIAVVLVQKSKGGGLASGFAGSNQLMGVRRTNDFIEKATWTLACAVAILSIISVLITPSGITTDSRVKMQTAPVETEGTEFAIPAPENAAEQLPATDVELPLSEPVSE